MKNPLDNEDGAVLIVGLMILVVLSLLGVTTMQTSTIEEKMANNMGQRQFAFQAAEAGLREAEARLAGLGGIDPTLPILTPAAPAAAPLWTTANRWTTTNALTGSQLGSGIAGVAEQPRYIVELLQEIPEGEEPLEADVPVTTETMYRVTSRGVGGVSTAEVILQITHLQ
ncbi:MAG TPA: PilX N-terminal domain-containing pilus assembly protein [Malonomonas sp.]